MTDNIVIGGDYVVGAKEQLVFADGGYAFYFAQTGDEAPSLKNKGEVSVVSDVAQGVGTDKKSDFVIFDNSAGASFTVQGQSAAYGFRFSTSANLTNDAEIAIVSSDGSARGVSSLGDELTFVNHSVFSVDGATTGIGVDCEQYGTFENSGSFTVAAGKNAEGVIFTHVSGFQNTGSFLVTGRHAVGVEFKEPQFVFTNDGQIVVEAARHAISYAIKIASAAPDNGLDDSPSFSNTGTIRADYAIFDARADTHGATGDIISNSGKIYGDIQLGGYDDFLNNSGSIRGDIDLGGGDDVFDDDVFGGAGKGVVHGVLYGGAGADQLSGGKGSDLIHGDGVGGSADDGADTIWGGAGDDELSGGGGGDRLLGGFGADLLDGGGGADTFIYTRATESTAADPDLIVGLASDDAIDLSPIDADSKSKQTNEDFTLVSEFDGHAGQLVIAYDAGTDTTSIMGDVNGDGVADLVIHAAGDQTGFTGIVL